MLTLKDEILPIFGIKLTYWALYIFSLAYFSYLKKIKVGLCNLHAVSVSVCPPCPQLLNGWTNLYETWYDIMTP
jgi:hypothetical protein